VVVYDLENNAFLYEQNEAVTFSAAGLINLPIVLVAYKLAQYSDLDLNTRLVLHESDKVGGTGVLQNVAAGTEYTLRELCKYMIIESDNTATNMVIDHLGGFSVINDILDELGIYNTRVNRYMMDMDAKSAGNDNLTTPADMALLLNMLAWNEIDSSNEILGFMQANKDRAKIPARLPTGADIMNQSGVLPAPGGSEHDIALVETANGRWYTVVFMSENLTNNSSAINAIAQASRLIYDHEQELD